MLKTAFVLQWQLSGCDSLGIYSLALYRKGLPTPVQTGFFVL